MAIVSLLCNFSYRFRQWFRSILLDHGGSFFDVFRAKHPDRFIPYFSYEVLLCTMYCELWLSFLTDEYPAF